MLLNFCTPAYLHAFTLARLPSQSPDIAAPDCHANLVKELKERDGVFAGCVYGFSELRCSETAALLAQLTGNLLRLFNGARMENELGDFDQFALLNE